MCCRKQTWSLYNKWAFYCGFISFIPRFHEDSLPLLYVRRKEGTMDQGHFLWKACRPIAERFHLKSKKTAIPLRFFISLTGKLLIIIFLILWEQHSKQCSSLFAWKTLFFYNLNIKKCIYTAIPLYLFSQEVEGSSLSSHWKLKSSLEQWNVCFSNYLVSLKWANTEGEMQGSVNWNT